MRFHRDGRPVYIEQLGKLDLKKLYEVTTPERQLQKLVVEYEKFQRERLPVCTAQKGELVETSCTIMDLKNVGLSQFWKVSGYVQEASKIGQYYYPETMGKVSAAGRGCEGVPVADARTPPLAALHCPPSLALQHRLERHQGAYDTR